MNESFEMKIKELKQFNKNEIDKSINELKENLLKIENDNINLMIELDASTFYLQGRTNFDQQKYEVAICDFLKSAEFWLCSKRPDRCLVLFANVLRGFKQLNKKESLDRIDDLFLKSTNKITLDERIINFELRVNKELFIKEINLIKLEIKRLKNISSPANGSHL